MTQITNHMAQFLGMTDPVRLYSTVSQRVTARNAQMDLLRVWLNQFHPKWLDVLAEANAAEESEGRDAANKLWAGMLEASGVK